MAEGGGQGAPTCTRPSRAPGKMLQGIKAESGSVEPVVKSGAGSVKTS